MRLIRPKTPPQAPVDKMQTTSFNGITAPIIKRDSEVEDSAKLFVSSMSTERQHGALQTESREDKDDSLRQRKTGVKPEDLHSEKAKQFLTQTTSFKKNLSGSNRYIAVTPSMDMKSGSNLTRSSPSPNPKVIENSSPFSSPSLQNKSKDNNSSPSPSRMSWTGVIASPHEMMNANKESIENLQLPNIESTTDSDHQDDLQTKSQYQIVESPKEAADASCSNPMQIALQSALDFTDGIGSAVQTYVCSEQSSGALKSNLQNVKMSRYLSTATFDTHDFEDLQYDMERIDKLNSWDTIGTFNTIGSSHNIHLPSSHAIDHTPSRIVHQTLQRENSKSTTNHTVKFEYPPVTSMKVLDRITEEERKLLFFTEDELYEIEDDRKYNLCDDIEVVAIHEELPYESTENEDSVVEQRSSQNDPIIQRPEVNPLNDTATVNKSCLKEGKYTPKREGWIKAPVFTDIDDQVEPSKIQNTGKLKGVHIYLRQRSVKRKNY